MRGATMPYLDLFHPRLAAELHLLGARCDDQFERVFQGDKVEMARLEGRLALTPNRPELQERLDKLRLTASYRLVELSGGCGAIIPT